MTTFKKLALVAAIVAPAMLAGVTAAQAQTVAVADPEAAVANSKAFTAATTQIQAQYKTQLDQAQTRRTAVQREIQPLLAALDTNKDGQLSQAEQEAAARATRPEVASIQQKQQAAAQELGRLEQPAVRAQQYAVEQITAKLPAALQAAIAKRNVTVLVRPNALLFAQPTADITSVITAELDAAVPSVSITPPANWQPGQQQGGAAPAAAPAATAPKKPTTGR